ncbi:MAG: transketolase [Bacteroidetes bacterium]|nr:MAG: transketolase [Bacteroidota bacterium]REK07618.1 MAG: transketolase [Bacteroidota bacterium]REK36950.1 MAG: transketolase [Bacteroidota bacterium]REK47770.1 MAG: transketolase [Bacteroidota bacterium]
MKEFVTEKGKEEIAFEEFSKSVLNDYRVINESRQASLLGRREVLTGKAKFGIFGDGKELAQVAMAKQFMPGDFRSGYYRDQTFMFAIGESDLRKFFAQLYANPDVELEPSSAGRSMNGHFSTRLIDDKGKWKELSKLRNSSSDISPTAGQMPRLLGLAWASKLYRKNSELHFLSQFSNKGNEVAFGTIGDASTSEGLFFETINAAGVLQIPMAISVWDDGYGISVPSKYQTTKQNISEILKGFERNEHGEGYVILRAKGWDYPGLCKMYEKGIRICREEHVPVLFHVMEMTQPQGHSTSGSHERYKSPERLKWEDDNDCIRKMREWIIASSIASAQECDAIEEAAKKHASESRKAAWNDFINPVRQEVNKTLNLIQNIAQESHHTSEILELTKGLSSIQEPARRDISVCINKILLLVRNENLPGKDDLISWLKEFDAVNAGYYNTYLFTDTEESPLKISAVAPEYGEDAQLVDGREILQANFDKLFETDPRIVAFGEDLGKIGDVNQGFAGLQSKFGEIRITDTGIREATIIGQGIGLALRGLRPIAEIQYLDYMLYALQILSDDLATLSYRTKAGQKAPLIIRTRGHRLEGIWHSGSPMGVIINALRGIHVLVPRDMTTAAGFYNTLLAGDEPGMIIECLNGYRLKERMPSNLGEYRIPLGTTEIIRSGDDVTLVTYGSCVRIAQEACETLGSIGISVELIDIRSLLPFDLNKSIVESLQRTNKLLVLDEDVPGGASAFILQQVLERQNGFLYLDSVPRTLTAKAHRPAYGSDGDYYSKPGVEDVIEVIYSIMNEYNPDKFPGYK